MKSLFACLFPQPPVKERSNQNRYLSNTGQRHIALEQIKVSTNVISSEKCTLVRNNTYYLKMVGFWVLTTCCVSWSNLVVDHRLSWSNLMGSLVGQNQLVGFSRSPLSNFAYSLSTTSFLLTPHQQCRCGQTLKSKPELFFLLGLLTTILEPCSL